MTTLRAFIFDLGNVLLLFSHQRMFEQIGALCDRGAADVREALIQDDLGSRFERGGLSEDELQAELERRLGTQFERESLHRAISDIFTPNEPMLRFVAELKQCGYRLVLLSNTNSIHIRWIESNYEVLSQFDACVLSHEVGALKPERAIYDVAIACANSSPSECFYTDDIEAYVSGGRNCGLQAEVFTGPHEFREQIAKLGVELQGSSAGCPF